MLPWTRRQTRRLLRRLAFACTPLLGLLVIAEGASRLLPEPAPSSEILPHPVLLAPHVTRIWGLTPGRFREGGVVIDVGDDGLRSVPTTDATHRVLTLGDSSIYGYGLADPDTLHGQLAVALGHRDVRADVRCGGVPGYSTEQVRILLEEVGWALAPDLLVLGMLWSDANTDHFVDREWLAAAASPSTRARGVMEQSALFRRLRRAVTPESAWTLPIGWLREPYATGRRRVPLDDYRENLAWILDQATERGVTALFLAPCNRMRLDRLDAPEDAKRSWVPYFQALEGLAESRGVPLVDGCTVLRSAGLTPEEAFLDDMHPTGTANAAYAQALALQAAELGWPAP